MCWVAFSQGNQAIGHGFISDGAIYRRADVLYAYRLGIGRFVRSEYGMTPLMLAARYDDPDLLHLALSSGAPINEADSSGQTALSYACYAGSMTATQELVTRGCAVNLPDAKGVTPLMEAASWGHIDLCRLLLARGADPTLRDNRGNGAAVHVAYCGNPKVVRTFLGLLSKEQRARCRSDLKRGAGVAKRRAARNAPLGAESARRYRQILDVFDQYLGSTDQSSSK